MRGRLPLRFPLPGCGRFLKHFDDLSVDVVEFVFHVEMSPFNEKMLFVTGTELRREVD